MPGVIDYASLHKHEQDARFLMGAAGKASF